MTPQVQDIDNRHGERTPQVQDVAATPAKTQARHNRRDQTVRQKPRSLDMATKDDERLQEAHANEQAWELAITNSLTHG